ncbi:hypothetical protein Hamer_G019364 [Homarus americanus]|uniref:Uncharacterized protein n=1 Tax=Homarus americanus TaxID=6706 RepID=A0A8J5JQQ0_HOMAM|nr:hypothetical protein Hamer_G019364 [Homarus americanus]
MNDSKMLKINSDMLEMTRRKLKDIQAGDESKMQRRIRNFGDNSGTLNAIQRPGRCLREAEDELEMLAVSPRL